MTQPENSPPPRGTRPQLFSAPDRAARRGGQPDFGPSILATIDGRQPRARARDRLPLKRVLLLALLALMVLAAYVGVKLAGSSSSAPTLGASTATAADPGPLAAVSPAPVPVAVPQAKAEPQGSAAIETVVSAPVAPAASAAATAAAGSAVALNANPIQRALERTETPAAAQPEQKVAGAMGSEVQRASRQEPLAARATAPAAMPAPTNTVPATRGAAKSDDDAELLAAMLPHLKRGETAPTSAAFQKRCGQLSGDAAVDCRAKFCNGREGEDAACPRAAAK